MRGEEPLLNRPLRGHRITPAHAGRSRVIKNSEGLRQDHPRACGEKASWAFLIAAWVGSPPRMRGKGDFVHQKNSFRRITPAHAGKRVLWLVRRLVSKDHPRACGEKRYLVQLDDNITGSPPRMRGKERFLTRSDQNGRITPAHAGKSPHAPKYQAHCRDHPRACGEKGELSTITPERQGSPPRMRGKVQHTHILSRLVRITPAHAGKSRRVRSRR